MKILIIDDHQMFREGLASFIHKQQPDWEIADCDSIDSAIELVVPNAFDVIISDYHMPGKTIKDLHKYLNTANAMIPIVVVSMDSDISILIECLNFGAKGYILKESSSFEVLDAIEVVGAGGFAFDQSVLGEIVTFLIEKSNRTVKKELMVLKDLTKREREVFHLLVEDKTIRGIAELLYISQKTVENHRTNIYRKLAVFDRYSLLEFLDEHGLR